MKEYWKMKCISIKSMPPFLTEDQPPTNNNHWNMYHVLKKQVLKLCFIFWDYDYSSEMEQVSSRWKNISAYSNVLSCIATLQILKLYVESSQTSRSVYCIEQVGRYNNNNNSKGWSVNTSSSATRLSILTSNLCGALSFFCSVDKWIQHSIKFYKKKLTSVWHFHFSSRYTNLR